MHRTDAAGHVGNQFSAGTPGVSPGTVLGPDWFNAVQEELIAILVACGIAPSKLLNDQLAGALMNLVTAQTVAGKKTFTGGIEVGAGANTTELTAGGNIISDGNVTVAGQITGGDITGATLTALLGNITAVLGNFAAPAGSVIVGGTASVVPMPAPVNVLGGIGFQNGWADSTNAGTYAQAGYWKDALRMGHLRGRVVAGGISGTTMFTLPAPQCPLVREVRLVPSFLTGGGAPSHAWARLEVLPTGEVQPHYDAGYTTIWLDGVTFPAVA